MGYMGWIRGIISLASCEHRFIRVYENLMQYPSNNISVVGYFFLQIFSQKLKCIERVGSIYRDLLSIVLSLNIPAFMSSLIIYQGSKGIRQLTIN